MSTPVAEPRIDSSASPEAGRERRPVLAGAVAAVWSLIVGAGIVLAGVLLTWTVSPNAGGDAAAATRAAGMTWLGAHLVPLHVGQAPWSVFPLGALLLGLGLTRRGGRWAAKFVGKPSAFEMLAILAGASLGYGVGGALIAWLCSTEALGASLSSALPRTAMVALVGTAWGVASQERVVARIRARMSTATARTFVAGLASSLALFALGSALVSLSLATQFGQAARTLGQADAGLLGTAMLTALDVLSLPNLAIWGASFAVGPGFDLGQTGYLTPWSGSVVHVPGLPVLAAIPAAPPPWAPWLLLPAIAVGVLASRIRWGRDLPTLGGAIGAAACVAPIVGVLMGVAAALSSGSLGGGELAHVGVDPLPAAGCAAGLVALGMVLDALLQIGTLNWQLHRARTAAAARAAEDVAARAAARAAQSGLAEPAGTGAEPGGADLGAADLGAAGPGAADLGGAHRGAAQAGAADLGAGERGAGEQGDGESGAVLPNGQVAAPASDATQPSTEPASPEPASAEPASPEPASAEPASAEPASAEPGR